MTRSAEDDPSPAVTSPAPTRRAHFFGREGDIASRGQRELRDEAAEEEEEEEEVVASSRACGE